MRRPKGNKGGGVRAVLARVAGTPAFAAALAAAALLAVALLWYPPLGPNLPPASGTAFMAPRQDAVYVNTAPAQELAVLPGIGEAKAAAIVEERTTGGPFLSLEDLGRVKGIGPKTLQQIGPLVCFD